MTDMNNTIGPLLKTDTQGRVRTSAQRRESLLAEFDQSGLSGSKFAELAGPRAFAGIARDGGRGDVWRADGGAGAGDDGPGR